ncbi:MAG: CAF17-like 4Fe-4S cluster assembly/insertion protein YgfZ [Acidimicrobiales bacterium]|jgi:hypothetical protein|nr:hypothetical protein [Actinomycetota bacterium]
MSEIDRLGVIDSDSAELRHEYQAMHETVGFTFLDHDFVLVSGPDAREYLQGQLSQDIAQLVPGSCCDSMLLDPNGHVVAVLRVSAVVEPRVGYMVEVESGFGEAVLERLSRFKIRAALDLEALELQCVAFRGPNSRTVVDELSTSGTVRAEVDWNGVGGVDLVSPSIEADLDSLATRCSRYVFEMCRIESGVPAMGTETVPGVIPAETGLVEKTVDLKKGCFTGQELVARMAARGNHAPRRLTGITWEKGDGLEPLDAKGASILSGDSDKRVGEITSSTCSFGFGGPLGLAYLHRSASADSELFVEPVGGFEGGRFRARLVQLPLGTISK